MRYESYFVRFDVGTDVEPIEQTDMGIYPNPTNDVIYIPNGLSDIKIFDIAGRQLYLSSNVDMMIDLSYFKSGAYILVAFDGEKIISTKIIKN